MSTFPVAARAPGAPFRVIFDGQSLNTIPAPPDSFPDVTMRGRAVPWVSVAVDGAAWLVLDDDVATRLNPHARIGAEPILVMCGGQGDLTGYPGFSIPAADAATVYTRAVAYADAFRAATVAAGTTGHVICTTIPAAPGLFDSTMNTERLAHNVLLLDHASTDPGTFDAVVNIGDPALADGVHPSAAGVQTMAAAVWPAIAALLS